MSLAELWSTSRAQLEGKQVHQIIAFAGTGQLSDKTDTASEFREFLGLVPSDYLARYADECLQESFPGSGFALQDVVNQVGKRLGYPANQIKLCLTRRDFRCRLRCIENS